MDDSCFPLSKISGAKEYHDVFLNYVGRTYVFHRNPRVPHTPCHSLQEIAGLTKVYPPKKKMDQHKWVSMGLCHPKKYMELYLFSNLVFGWWFQVFSTLPEEMIRI